MFEKPFKKSRIEIDDKFINRVVPDIIEHSPELKMTAPAQDSPRCSPAFLQINGELRKINADEIAALAAKTSPNRLWDGPFMQLGNSQVEASFADHRTYIYKGKEVDQQTHLGFDLAVTAHVPVPAANAGTVRQRQLARHLRQLRHHRSRPGRAVALRPPVSFDVKVGDKVTRGQTSAGATRPAWPAAITCISRCWSAAAWSTRSNGGTPTG